MGSWVGGFAAAGRFGARLASGPSVAVAVVLLAEPVAVQLVAERPGGRPSPAGVVAAARRVVVPAAESAVAAEPFGQPFPVAAVAPVVSQPAEPAALPVAWRLAFGPSVGHLADLPWHAAPPGPAEPAAGRLVSLPGAVRLIDSVPLLVARSFGQSLVGQRLF